MLNPRNYLYLTDFLNRTFWGENAQNFDFCGGKIRKPGPVYHPRLNHAARLPERFSLCNRAFTIGWRRSAALAVFVAAWRCSPRPLS
jgi:hypothetical protein